MSTLLPDEVVTLVIRHSVKPEQATAYESWLRNTVQVASTFPGHLGVDVIRGKHNGLHTFTCVLRYSSTLVMQQWLDSPERQQLIAQAAPLLSDGDRTEVNPQNEFWFTTPDDSVAPPPRWKQAVLSMLVILPLTLGVPIVWGPIFKLNAWFSNYLISTFFVTLTIVILVVYVLMPFATRLLSPWLQPASEAAPASLTD